MKLLPFIIIILCSAVIFKTSDLIERFFTEPSFTITNVNAEKQLETKKEISDDKNNTKTQTASDEKKPSMKNSAGSDNSENFIKECVSQKHNYTETELQILDNLNNKKSELDKREETIIEKEKLLNVAADQVESKLQILKDKESSIKLLLAEYTDKEDAKIDHLVKIYQNMKPDKAAKLFDIIDMDILIKVVKKMKETNSGAIISLMDSNKATELTLKLAQQKISNDDLAK